MNIVGIDPIQDMLQGTQQPKQNYYEQLNKIMNEINELKKYEVNWSKPLISINGDSVIFPNTINIIQGGKGNHKSRLAEVFLSTILKGSFESGTLRMERNGAYNDVTAVLVDTERNKNEQLVYATQQILRLANRKYSEDYPDFKVTSLIEIDRANRLNAVQEWFDGIRKENPDTHIFAVIDVLTDVSNDFNNSKDSLAVLDYLNKIINNENATFVVIVHENPSPMNLKARGHLGTESTNKASTVMSIRRHKETDMFDLKFLNTRTVKEPNPIRLEYCSEVKTLKGVEHTQDDPDSETNTSGNLKSEIINLLLDNDRNMLQSKLTSELVETTGNNRTTIGRKLKSLTQHSIKHENELYVLRILKDGRQNVVKLSHPNELTNEDDTPDF